MFTRNGTTPSPNTSHLVEAQLETLKEGLRKLVAQLEATAEPPRSRVRGLAARATGLVKAYPLAAAGLAVGLGYTLVRIFRR